jgi:hypothetical protein
MRKNPQMLISAKEAADILHEDPRNIQRKATDGKLPFVTKLPGLRGAYVFDKEVIESIASGEVVRAS